MLWLSLHFYQLPIDIFTIKYLDDHEAQSMVVVENGKLLYCNLMAVNQGLEVGMKISTAYALTNRLIVKNRSLAAEANALTQLATICYGFSSQVCLYDDKSLLLEVESSCKLFGDLLSLLGKISDHLSELSNQFYCGLADTPKAAFLLSCSKECNMKSLLISIKDQSNIEIAQQGKKLLEQINVSYLCYEPHYFTEKKTTQIQQMGIRSLSELFSLPISSVGRRFGKKIVEYIQCLKGIKNDPQDLFLLPESFLSQRCFVSGLDTLEQVLFPAKPMLQQLLVFMNLRKVRATKIMWRFTCFNQDELFFEIALSSEVQNLESLMMLTRLKLQGFELTEKIEMVFLRVEEFLLVKEKQKGLFVNDSEQCRFEDVGHLLEVINARVGDHACSGLMVENEYLPEERSMATLNLIEKKKAIGLELLNSSFMFESPLWIFDSVENVQARHQINYKGALKLLSKPERIESGWWKGASSRDYYKAENRSGVCYWVYFDRDKKQWFVHGVF